MGPWPWVRIRSDLGLSVEFSPPCPPPSIFQPLEDLPALNLFSALTSRWSSAEGNLITVGEGKRQGLILEVSLDGVGILFITHIPWKVPIHASCPGNVLLCLFLKGDYLPCLPSLW